MKLFRLFAIALIIVTPTLAAADLIDLQGGIGAILDDPPITVGADWFASTSTPPAFFWAGALPTFNSEGPFTYSSTQSTVIDVTDDFLKGDRFEVFDFGVSLGLTSLVATGGGVEIGPQAAFDDPTFSSGSFLVGPGNHSITIQTLVGSFDSGRGYIRVLTQVPEPSTLALLGLGVFGLAARSRRRKR